MQREAEISAFQPESFYTVHLDFDGFSAAGERMKEQAEAEWLAEDCNSKAAAVTSVVQTKKTEKAPALYDLTTLQRDANRLLGYTAQQMETRQYASLQELITNELENLDFSDLIHVSDEDVEQHRWHEPEEPAPAPQREPFPYSVGDTVYLEDGKPFIIENIGLFDISLRDPTLFYPISRAESRESFARLMERYPQPEKTAAENTAVPEKEPKPAYTEENIGVQGVQTR